MMRNRDEQGQAIVLLALLITGVVAVAGLAVDGGRLYSARRNAQNAADNAALAAALALCADENPGIAALASAATNGFNNDGSISLNNDGIPSTVDVNVPPSSGPNAGDSDYIEVVIAASETGTISQLVFSGELAYSARAVGHCTNASTAPGDGYALIVLRDEGGPSYSSPYDRYPLKSKPGGIISVDGNIFVNSDSPSGYSSYGHDCGQPHAQFGVKADAGATVGPSIYEDCAPNYINPNPSLNTAPMADPLSALAAPANPGSCTALLYDVNDTGSINPGCYSSITVRDNANLTMNAGTYYVTGAILLRDNGRITANGVMVYMTSGDFTMQDASRFTISAPNSGVYEGMALFFDNGDTFNVHENSVLTVSAGTIYAPNAFMQVYGLTSGYRAYLIANASQVIVDSVWVGSSSGCTTYTSCPSVRGDLLLTYDPNQIYGTAGAAMIELSE